MHQLIDDKENKNLGSVNNEYMKLEMIHSGFRSQQLNAEKGGKTEKAKNSQHASKKSKQNDRRIYCEI